MLRFSTCSGHKKTQAFLESRFPHVAMKRFMSSAASSSSARAEPATTSLGSAEQPGPRCQLKLSSIRDVQRWLAMEPIASCSSADMLRIREAAAVLVHGKPRQEDLRPLQSKWLVARMRNKKPRPLEEVVHEFQDSHQSSTAAAARIIKQC